MEGPRVGGWWGAGMGGATNKLTVGLTASEPPRAFAFRI